MATLIIIIAALFAIDPSPAPSPPPVNVEVPEVIDFEITRGLIRYQVRFPSPGQFGIVCDDETGPYQSGSGFAGEGISWINHAYSDRGGVVLRHAIEMTCEDGSSGTYSGVHAF